MPSVSSAQIWRRATRGSVSPLASPPLPTGSVRVAGGSPGTCHTSVTWRRAGACRMTRARVPRATRVSSNRSPRGGRASGNTVRHGAPIATAAETVAPGRTVSETTSERMATSTMIPARVALPLQREVLMGSSPSEASPESRLATRIRCRSASDATRSLLPCPTSSSRAARTSPSPSPAARSASGARHAGVRRAFALR